VVPSEALSRGEDPEEFAIRRPLFPLAPVPRRLSPSRGELACLARVRAADSQPTSDFTQRFHRSWRRPQLPRRNRHLTG
jgi:hypothetical protein